MSASESVFLAFLRKESLCCLNSSDQVMQQAAASDCHRTDLLLSKEAFQHSCLWLSENEDCDIVFHGLGFTFTHHPPSFLKRLSNCPGALSVHNSGGRISKGTSAKSDDTGENENSGLFCL